MIVRVCKRKNWTRVKILSVQQRPTASKIGRHQRKLDAQSIKLDFKRKLSVHHNLLILNYYLRFGRIGRTFSLFQGIPPIILK